MHSTSVICQVHCLVCLFVFVMSLNKYEVQPYSKYEVQPYSIHQGRDSVFLETVENGLKTNEHLFH